MNGLISISDFIQSVKADLREASKKADQNNDHAFELEHVELEVSFELSVDANGGVHLGLFRAGAKTAGRQCHTARILLKAIEVEDQENLASDGGGSGGGAGGGPDDPLSKVMPLTVGQHSEQVHVIKAVEIAPKAKPAQPSKRSRPRMQAGSVTKAIKSMDAVELARLQKILTEQLISVSLANKS